MKNNFIDEVKIYCKSGKGGRGSVHFYRARGVPKGGPDGGDGGDGGDIYMVASRHVSTLFKLRYAKHVLAENGGAGSGNRKKGANGKDRILEVPIGTIAKNEETGETIGEVTEEGQKIMIAKGGKGGLGNSHFSTSTNQSPKYAQKGEPSEELEVIFELQLLADVGPCRAPKCWKINITFKALKSKNKNRRLPLYNNKPCYWSCRMRRHFFCYGRFTWAY